MILHLIVCLLSSFCLFGEQDYFLKGNHLFEQGQYAQACQAYAGIKNPGFSVLYNTALSYLHQNNIAQTTLYIQRAEKQATFQELSQLYELTQWMQQQKNPEYSPSLFDLLAIFLKKCILSISMLFLQIIILMMLVLLMVLWYRRWYCVYKKTIGCLMAIFFITIFMYWYKNYVQERHIGIVTKETISLHVGPDISFYEKSQLHAPDQVKIIGKQQAYYQVATQDQIGWVCDKDIELV
jgi:hypothetical protein